MHRCILHVDMDAFYASVEIRDRPELRGKPVVVGGSPEGRGVVAAASYPARRFGIHSAMSARTAVRLCPDIVFVAPRHNYYADVSAQIRQVLNRYTPQVEPLALDEAFLDVTASLRLWGTGAEIGRRIKTAVRDELGLVASVGVAPNKFLAKLASDLDKPDGFIIVEPDSIQDFLDPLPVSRLWGVGKAGQRTMAKLGVRTVADLRRRRPQQLESRFGEWGRHLWRLAHGRDDRPVMNDREAKSISHETTFSEDLSEIDVLRSVLLDLTEQVARRLRRYRRTARTVELKLRFSDFITITRSKTLARATDVTHHLWQTADELLIKELRHCDRAVRLLGMGVGALDADPCDQLELFTDRTNTRQSGLDRITDRISDRFGAGTIHRGPVQRK